MAGDPLGFALAYGAQGGYKTLEHMMARQELARQQAVKEEMLRQQEAGRQEDRELRRRDFDERAKDRQTDNARLDRAEAAQTALRNTQDEDKKNTAAAEAERKKRLADLANDPNADPELRKQATYLLMTGSKTVPTEMLRDRKNESDIALDRALQIIQARDKVNDGNRAAAVDAKSADDPKAPRGVKNYLLDLRGKYKTVNEAVEELDRAWPEILKAHPNADASVLVGELRKMFDTPRGVRQSSSQIGNVDVKDR